MIRVAMVAMSVAALIWLVLILNAPPRELPYCPPDPSECG